MKNSLFLVLILLSGLSHYAVAQIYVKGFEMNSGELRTVYHQKLSFNDKYSGSFDAGSYIGIGNNSWTRWGLRGSIKRNLNYKTGLDIGFMYNHITFDHKINQEFRPHQSFYIDAPTLPHSVIQHRFRLEERIFIDNISNETTVRSRIRYRISNNGTLRNKPVAPKTFFYKLSAEWNFNIYNEIEDTFLLRGRYGIGYGYQFNSKYTADATYFFQHDAQNDTKSHNVMHIFQLTLRHSIRLN